MFGILKKYTLWFFLALLFVLFGWYLTSHWESVNRDIVHPYTIPPEERGYFMSG